MRESFWHPTDHFEDKELARRMEPPHLRDAMLNPSENLELPNVLIIGDSISIGYTLVVRTLLNGIANVFRPSFNCAHSGCGARDIKEWVGDETWDIIHFNFGIWDTHYLRKDVELVNPKNLREYQTEDLTRRYTTKQYLDNLKEVIRVLKMTNAKLIWASTTPFVSYGEDTNVLLMKNNQAAGNLMEKENIQLNDLFMLALPNLKEWQSEDGCHFNKQGYENLGRQVASMISSALCR